jgi:hypothetical protein
MHLIFSYGGNYIIDVLERSQSFSHSPIFFTCTDGSTAPGSKMADLIRS